VPALGTRPDFIAALADLVKRGAAGQPAAAPLVDSETVRLVECAGRAGGGFFIR
jgi:hypothetical protein